MKTAMILLGLASPMMAQFITPEWRDESGSSHAAWDLFTQAKFAPNFPDVVDDPEATLICSTSSAFLTSSGNIYSFQSPLSLQLDDETDFEVRNVLLQVRTLGAGLDREGVVLIYEDADGETKAVAPSRSFVTSEEELTGERGGIGTTYSLQWDLRESPLTGSYSILFGALTSSLSLDQVSLDLAETYQKVEKPDPLTVRVSQGEVVVTWFGNRQLQSSRTMAGDWADVPGSEGVNEIRLPVESGARFFRLIQADTNN